jgi:histone H3/H4
VLPVSRVKRICRLDGDVRQVSGDAVRLVAQATVRALRESGTLFFGRSSCQSSAFRKLTPLAPHLRTQQELFIASLTAGAYTVAASNKRRSVRFADVGAFRPPLLSVVKHTPLRW